MDEAASVPLPTPTPLENDSSDYSYSSYASDDSGLSSPPVSPQTPPGFYPSPPPSDEQQQQQQQQPSSQRQDEPARKKRRVGPTPRFTQHLDLNDPSKLQLDQLDLLTKTLRKHRKIVVIAGAGISTSAGSKSTRPLLLFTSWLTHCRSPRFPLFQWPFQVGAEEAQPQGFRQAAV